MLKRLPAGWRFVRLGDHFDIIGGGTPSRAEPSYWGGTIPWASVKDITGPALKDTQEYITPVGLSNSASKLIDPGRIVLATRMALGRASVTTKQTAINQDLKALEPVTQEVSVRYLYWYLISQADQLDRAGVGATVRGITTDYLRRLLIPLPPAPEDQAHIAALIDAASEVGLLRLQTQSEMQKLVPALFYDMFGDPSVNPKQHLQTSLGTVCRRITDGTHQPPPFVLHGVPFLFVSNIVRGRIDFSDTRHIDERTYENLTRVARPERGDILYSIVGSYGVAVTVDTDKPFAFQRHIALLKPDPARVDSLFLCCQMNMPFVKTQADARVRGVAQKTLNLGEVRRLRILLPTLKKQRDFTARVSEVRLAQDQQAESANLLDAFLTALLNRAFTGGLDRQAQHQVLVEHRIADEDNDDLSPALEAATRRPIWNHLSNTQRQIWKACLCCDEPFSVGDIVGLVATQTGEAHSAEHIRGALDLLTILGVVAKVGDDADYWQTPNPEVDLAVRV